MTWTYTPSDISSDLNKVRVMIGDTNPNDEQLSDEEIQFAIETQSDLRKASAQCCWMLAAHYARMVDKWVGDLKLLASQRTRQYRELADYYGKDEDIIEGSGVSIYGVPSSGGIYVAEKYANEQNSALVKPFFKRNMLDPID